MANIALTEDGQRVDMTTGEILEDESGGGWDESQDAPNDDYSQVSNAEEDLVNTEYDFVILD